MINEKHITSACQVVGTQYMTAVVHMLHPSTDLHSTREYKWEYELIIPTTNLKYLLWSHSVALFSRHTRCRENNDYRMNGCGL